MLVSPVRGRALKLRTILLLAVVFTFGATAGGIVTGSLFFLLGGLIQWFPAVIRSCMLCGLVGAAVWLSRRKRRVRLPQRQVMIPPTRFAGSLRSGFLLFGFELGLGFRTIIPSVGPYLAAAAVLLLSESLTDVMLISLGWGVGRSVPLWLRVHKRSRGTHAGGGSEVGLTVTAFEVVLGRLSSLAARLGVPLFAAGIALAAWL